MTDLHTVFVYGTLKAGYSNHYLLKTSEKLGSAVSLDRFRMKMLGYPCIFMDPAVNAQNGEYGIVRGELYRVTDSVLERLDDLESNGIMFVRHQHPFYRLEDPANVHTTAWVYQATAHFRNQISNYKDILPNENGHLIWPPQEQKEWFAT